MSTRLVLAISATTFGASLLFGAFSMVEQQEAAQAALDQQLELQYKSVVAALDTRGGRRAPSAPSSPGCRRSRRPSRTTIAPRSALFSCRASPR